MTFYVDKEAELFQDGELDSFNLEEVTKQVIETVMRSESCPFEVEVDILLTNNEKIRRLNQETRQKDEPTDVLSFPYLWLVRPADFSALVKESTDFNPESGELMLGNIVISAEKLREQAKLFNHSLKREYAFLLTHSLFHLLGYDHGSEEEARVMEEKQESILEQLGIRRKG
jgi:probable rRNA maturation factor